MYCFSSLFLTLIALCNFVHADNSCSSSNALVVENLSPSGSGPRGENNTVVIQLGQGLVKADILHLKKRSGGHDDGQGGGGGGGSGSGNGNSGNSGNGGNENGNGNGNGLECSNSGSGSETCYSIQGIPFCYNSVTGTFHAVRISGNANSGNYVLLTGQTGNLYSGPFPTPSGTLTANPTATSTSGNEGNGGNNGGHGGNSGSGGGHGSDDSLRTPTTTSTSQSGSSQASVIVAAATTTSGIFTATSDVLTTTIPVANSSRKPSTTVVLATASQTTQATTGGAGRLNSPVLGLPVIIFCLFFL